MKTILLHNDRLILTIIFLLTMSLACKKESVLPALGPFDYLVGRWKPIQLIDFSSFGSKPPISPRPGTEYHIENDKIIKRLTSFYKDSSQMYAISQYDTFNLYFDIRSHLENDSILQIQETYQGLKADHSIAFELKYMTKITLKEGVYHYGLGSSCCSYRIEEGKLYLRNFSYYSSSIEDKNRILIKLD